MEVIDNYTGSRTPDNELFYLDYLEVVTKFSDPYCILRIDRATKGMQVTITPSNPDFKEHIVKNILSIHQAIQLKIRYSSSLERSKKVSFLLEI